MTMRLAPLVLLVVAPLACGRHQPTGGPLRCALLAGRPNPTADPMTLKDSVWDERGDGHRWYLSELPDQRTGLYTSAGYQVGLDRPPAGRSAVGGVLTGDRTALPDTFAVRWAGRQGDSIRLRRVSAPAGATALAVDSFIGVVTCDSLRGTFWARDPGGKRSSDTTFIHWWLQ